MSDATDEPMTEATDEPMHEPAKEPSGEPTEAGVGTRRRSTRPEVPEMPTGYRSSRRASRSAKQAKRAMRQHRVVTKIDSAGRTARRVLGWVVAAVVVTAVVGGVVVLLASGINALVRWNAQRDASSPKVVTVQQKRARESVLFIAEKGGKATGFLASRIDAAEKQVFGIAIPGGAFIEVPGQGFEKVGDSYLSGPDVSMSAISNFLSVQFERYAVISEAAYQTALRTQSMKSVMASVTKTNLTAEQRETVTSALAKIGSKDVALATLEVKPITVGKETYFEPQREKLADIVESWWGVKISDAENVTRLIVYNGSGAPGIAGEAAQQLIRGGFRVVDTKNADKFTYAQTQIVVQNGDMAAGSAVRAVLKTGKVVNQPGNQDVADVIVIIGKDYSALKASK